MRNLQKTTSNAGKKTGPKEIKLRTYSIAICDEFENLLEKHGIAIPDEDRTGAGEEACIYGMTYAELEDSITHLLLKLVAEVKNNPAAMIDIVNA